LLLVIDSSRPPSGLRANAGYCPLSFRRNWTIF
jgi:hypothetical protein